MAEADNYTKVESLDTKDDKYTKDGTVDYRGNPANKTDTGTWKACPYILGIFMFSCSFRLPELICEKMFIDSYVYQQGMNVAKDWRTME